VLTRTALFIILLTISTTVFAAAKYDLKCTEIPQFTGMPAQCFLTIWPVDADFFKKAVVTFQGATNLLTISFKPSDENADAAVAQISIVLTGGNVELVLNGEMLDGKINFDSKTVTVLPKVKGPFIFKMVERPFRLLTTIIIISCITLVIILTLRFSRKKKSKINLSNEDLFNSYIMSAGIASYELKEHFRNQFINEPSAYSPDKKRP